MSSVKSLYPDLFNANAVQIIVSPEAKEELRKAIREKNLATLVEKNYKRMAVVLSGLRKSGVKEDHDLFVEALKQDRVIFEFVWVGKENLLCDWLNMKSLDHQQRSSILRAKDAISSFKPDYLSEVAIWIEEMPDDVRNEFLSIPYVQEELRQSFAFAEEMNKIHGLMEQQRELQTRIDAETPKPAAI